MKKRSIVLLVLTLMVAGCSANSGSSSSNKTWDYKQGYVVQKGDNRILVVPNKIETTKVSVDRILKAAEPNAIWLSVNESDYAAVEVLDHVSISIDGAIDQSYPMQASADVTNVREAAWNGVSEAEKKSVIGDWKTVEVAEADVKELEVSTLRGEETPQVEHLYKVTFPTKDDGLLGPITVFVNGDTNEVLGYGLRF